MDSKTFTDELPTYVGGIRLGGANATWPLAKLSLSDQGIEAGLRGPIRLWRFTLPVPFSGAFRVSMRWTDIKQVAPVQGRIPGNPGVAFHGNQRLVFWCFGTTRDQVLSDVRRLAPTSLLISEQTERIF